MRTRVTRRRHRLAIAAALTAAAALSGCRSDSSSGKTPLSLSCLTKTADGVPDEGTSTCPLPYDMVQAAKAAGLDAETDPGLHRTLTNPSPQPGVDVVPRPGTPWP